MGFGPVYEHGNDVVSEMIECTNNGFYMKDEYLRRVRMFFPLRDRHNCHRIFKEICSLVEKDDSSGL